MGMVKTGRTVALGAIGMKPENRPVTLGMMLLMGTQGLSNVDWTTEWFCGSGVNERLGRGREERKGEKRRGKFTFG